MPPTLLECDGIMLTIKLPTRSVAASILRHIVWALTRRHPEWPRFVKLWWKPYIFTLDSNYGLICWLKGGCILFECVMWILSWFFHVFIRVNKRRRSSSKRQRSNRKRSDFLDRNNEQKSIYVTTNYASTFLWNGKLLPRTCLSPLKCRKNVQLTQYLVMVKIDYK